VFGRGIAVLYPLVEVALQLGGGELDGKGIGIDAAEALGKGFTALDRLAVSDIVPDEAVRAGRGRAEVMKTRSTGPFSAAVFLERWTSTRPRNSRSVSFATKSETLSVLMP